MIGKLTIGGCFSGLVNYINDKAKDARLFLASGVHYNSNQNLIDSFKQQASLNPRLTKAVGHISLSFSPKDSHLLDDRRLALITTDYLKRMGIVNTQFIAVKHCDKEHPHVHICFNRVDNEGKTISDINGYYRNEKVCKELTRKYGLHIANGKDQVNRERLKEPDKTRYEIYDVLNPLLKQASDWRQLLKALQKEEIATNFVYKGNTTQIQGITFGKNGYTFNGSQIDREFSYSKINTTLKNNQQAGNSVRESVSSQSYATGSHDLGLFYPSSKDLRQGIFIFQNRPLRRKIRISYPRRKKKRRKNEV